MASDKKLLLNSLKDLRKEDLKEFQWHLENDHERILKSDVENADIFDTVDLMTKRFGPEEAVKIMVSILKEMNQNNLAKELENKHKQAQAEGRIKDPAHVGVSSTPMEDSHQFTLDLNTVNKRLLLSENNRVITFTDTFPNTHPYPDHPDRFDDAYQVLCRESVCERCYWEIECSGDDVFISVSYKSISRKGRSNKCEFGCNDQSWSLICSSSRYTFIHNNRETELPVKPISGRIGVYVDPSAGTLSFYSVSDTMSLIHTVQTTFTHSLYPGFRVYSGSVKLC